MSDFHEKIARLQELLAQYSMIEKQIGEILNGGTIESDPGNVRKRGRKPKVDHPWIDGKRRGRPRTIKNYVCSDCGKPFQSNLGKLDVRCIHCRSVNVEVGVKDGEVEEDN